jgi:hypothetical protein
MKRIMIFALLAFELAVFASGKNVSEPPQANDRQSAAAQANANPASLDFGSQEIQTISNKLIVTLTNKTDKPIKVRDVDTSGGHWEDFEDDYGCIGIPIAPGESCKVGVTFSPLEVGARSSFLLITYDDQDHPQKIPLKGNGIKPGNVTAFAKFKPFQ